MASGKTNWVGVRVFDLVVDVDSVAQGAQGVRPSVERESTRLILPLAASTRSSELSLRELGSVTFAATGVVVAVV